jgi:hypothetical protein
MTSYANRFQLISVSSNLSAAIHSLDESITTGVVGDLYNYDVKGLNLYGLTSTSSFPDTGYVPSFSSNVTTHNSDGQNNVWGLETANMSQWNGKPYVSISSNGNYITGNYQCKVFYLFDGINNKSWQQQNPFSGEIGTLDKDNLIVYNNYVKPSYFTNNGISNFNTKLVFSSNDGGYHPFDVVLTFGDLGVTATKTISGIFVPSAVDLSNYYKKTETSSKQEISNAVNNLFNYFGDANQYVQSSSSRIDSVVESYLTSGGLFLNCYETVNANSGDWGQGGGGNPEVESYVQTNSANIDDTVTSYQTNSGTFLTAHQAISAEEWNDCYDNVNTNSGAWGGSALPISARDGIDLEIDNNILYIGASALSDDVANKLDTTAFSDVSATFLTAHQDISNLMPKSESANFYPMTGNPSGFINELPNTEEVEFEEIDLSSFATSSQINELSGAIDYVSANAGGGGYNETVLWSGDASAFSLSEAATGFDNLQITYYPTEGGTACSTVMNVPSTATSINLFSKYFKSSNDFIIEDMTKFITNDYTNYSYGAGCHAWYSTLMERQGGAGGDCFNRVTKVVGINRK